MKTRESGMPEENIWETFFRAEEILDRLAPEIIDGNVVDFGCGYGTFTLAAAARTRGIVYAIDIEPGLTELVATKSVQADLKNVRVISRDFVAQGTGLPESIADYAMMFNILHAEQPEVLLAEAWRVLRPGGLLGIIHWSPDPTTPRGPSMDIRPRPDQCERWAQRAGFLPFQATMALPPYHYGIVMQRPSGTLETG